MPSRRSPQRRCQTLTDSTVSNNLALAGGGIYNYGDAYLTVVGGTVSENQAGEGGGGIYNEGTLTGINGSVIGNRADEYDGGIANQGGTLELSNSTVAKNSAAGGGDGGLT